MIGAFCLESHRDGASCLMQMSVYQKVIKYISLVHFADGC